MPHRYKITGLQYKNGQSNDCPFLYLDLFILSQNLLYKSNMKFYSIRQSRNDFMTAQKSIQFGEPLVQKSRDTELAREICRIVDKYAKPGTEEEQDKDSKGGFFSRLFS